MNRNILKRDNQGFTLVEIMIVVAIVGLLAALAVPGFVKSRKQSQGRRVMNDCRQMDAAIDQWSVNSGIADGTTVDTVAARHIPEDHLVRQRPARQPVLIECDRHRPDSNQHRDQEFPRRSRHRLGNLLDLRVHTDGGHVAAPATLIATAATSALLRQVHRIPRIGWPTTVKFIRGLNNCLLGVV